MDEFVGDLTVLAVRQDAVRTAVQIHDRFPSSDAALLKTADLIAAFILEGIVPETTPHRVPIVR